MSASSLFTQYTPLAKQIARGFKKKLPCTVLLEDIEAAALLGLWDAVTRGASHEAFEYYVRVRIRGAIQDELRTEDWLPRRAREHNPEFRIRSFEEFENLDGIQALTVLPEAEQLIEQKERALVLAKRVADLPAREAEILADVFEGKSHLQIAAEMGISEPRISQIRKRAEQRILGERPEPRPPRRRSPKPSPEPVRSLLWESLMSGALQYAKPSRAFELTLRKPKGPPRPLAPRHASVLKYWLLCGRVDVTARHFALSRAGVHWDLTAALKALGFTDHPSRVPLIVAVAAQSSELGIDLEVIPTGTGFWMARVPEREDWLGALSSAERSAVLGLLSGETREAIAQRRDTSARTVANQLTSGFRKLGVSTAGELRAEGARVHAPAPSTLGFSGLVA